LKDEVEVVKPDGKRKMVRGAAAKIILWMTEHADFFNSADVRGQVRFDFAGEGGCASPKVEIAPSA
jgi:hypothetical protein